jgi:hypothetical protein
MPNVAHNEKIQYNNLLRRWHKYENFVENPEISMDEKLKWVPEARKLMQDMGRLLDAIKAQGHEYTEKEVLETGFEV